MSHRSPLVTQAAWVATCLLVAAWGLRWLWGPELPPGVDVTGHLTRIEAGLELFQAGRLDGWFDRAMLGYQLHLLYGPGLALVVGLVRVLSLGTISVAGATEVVGVAGTVAVAFGAAALGRGLGLPTNAARVAGLVALAVSSGRGTGIQGAFFVGQMANVLAAPLVLFAWAEMLRPETRRVLLGVLVAAVVITHPPSAVILVGFTPLVLGAGALCGVVDWRRWRGLAGAAVVAVGVSAWWWLPMVVHRDLRGLMTSWDLPGFVEHLRLLLRGQRGLIGWTGPLVGAAWVGMMAVGVWRRDRRYVALATLPLVALGALHLVQYTVGPHFREAVLFPNRALTFVGYLATPMVGWAVYGLLRRFGSLSWLITAVVVAVSVSSLVPNPSLRDRPVAGMRRAAETLALVVPDGSRFAYVESDIDQVGAPAPGRWLGWASGRANLGPFGPEYAPGSDPTLMVFDPPSVRTVNSWVAKVRALQVSHLVAGDVDTAEVLGRARHLRLIAEHAPVTIWAVEGRRAVQVVAAEPEHLVLQVDAGTSGGEVPLAVGYSPGWEAWQSGESVSLSRHANHQLAANLGPGGHRLELRWRQPAIHRYGAVLTGATVVSLAGIGLWPRIRRVRQSS